MRHYRVDPTERPRYRPLDYSHYNAAANEWMQTAIGFVVTLVGVLLWNSLAKTTWGAVGGWVGWVVQALVLGACAVGLYLLDGWVRRRWGWERFRTGILLGVAAIAAFWIVRLVIWGIVTWIGNKALSPAQG